MNGAVVTIKIMHIYVNRFFLPFPAHDDAASEVGEYLRHTYTRFRRRENSLGPCAGRAAFACANVCRSLAHRSGVIVGAVDVEVDIADAESRRYGVWLWNGGEDDDKGEQEWEKGEERAEWYGSWPSEKEDACAWKEVKSVCVELTVPWGARLNCEAWERRLDARLWCRARRSIEGVRGVIVKAGVESSPVHANNRCPRRGWCGEHQQSVSSTGMMSIGSEASESGVSSS